MRAKKTVGLLLYLALAGTLNAQEFRATISGVVADPTGAPVLQARVMVTSGFYFTDAAVQKNGVVSPALQRSDSRINLANNYRTFSAVSARLPRPGPEHGGYRSHEKVRSRGDAEPSGALRFPERLQSSRVFESGLVAHQREFQPGDQPGEFPPQYPSRLMA